MGDFGGETVWTRLAALPPERLIPYLSAQAPQTVAALLLLLVPDRAAVLLAGLSEDLRARALRCMAVTRPAAPDVLADLERVLCADLLDPSAPAPGADRSAEVMRIVDALPADQRGAAMEALKRPVPPLSATVPASPPATAVDVPSGLPRRLSPGMAAMLNARAVLHDRLPMLEVVLDRFVRILSTTLRGAMGQSAEVGLNAIRSARLGDWITDRAPDGPLYAVFRADPWDNFAMLALHRDLLDSVGEVLLGGDAETAGLRVVGRAPTGIDRAFAERMARAALSDLATAFAPIAAVSFPFDRMEDNARFATITRLHNACCVVDMTVWMDGCPANGRSGRFELLLPYATLEPVAGLLGQMFMGERFGRDPRWETHLRGELVRASVRLQAVAGSTTLPLGAMLAWRAGTVFELDNAAVEEAVLTVGRAAVARGVLGCRGSRWAVAVQTRLSGAGAEPVGKPVAVAPVPLPDAVVTGTMAMDTMTMGVVAGAQAEAAEIHKVAVGVSMVVGEAEMTVDDLLRLAPGDVVELDRKVGEPVSLIAEDRLVARGEPVAVAGRLGVRLLEVGRLDAGLSDAGTLRAGTADA